MSGGGGGGEAAGLFAYLYFSPEKLNWKTTRRGKNGRVFWPFSSRRIIQLTLGIIINNIAAHEINETYLNLMYKEN